MHTIYKGRKKDMEKTDNAIKEALRYMGVPIDKASEELKDKVKQSFKKLEKIQQSKVIYQKLPLIKKTDKVIISTPSCQTKSKDLIKLFKHSASCIVMAATLGYAVDIEIHRLQKIDMLEAMILDACASAYIEIVCDKAELNIMKDLEEGTYLTMRFSPGYGDVPLSLNKAILNFLMAQKRIGLSLTETLMLLPTKSVTALLGLSNQKENRAKSCVNCTLVTTCIYRKRGETCGL